LNLTESKDGPNDLDGEEISAEGSLVTGICDVDTTSKIRANTERNPEEVGGKTKPVGCSRNKKKSRLAETLPSKRIEQLCECNEASGKKVCTWGRGSNLAAQQQN